MIYTAVASTHPLLLLLLFSVFALLPTLVGLGKLFVEIFRILSFLEDLEWSLGHH